MNPRAHFRARILPRLSVAAVYGDGLRWRGDRGTSACPLHHGDNPASFTVFADNLNWYCRTHCEKVNGRRSGGPVEFIALSKGLTEREAIAYLSKLAAGHAPRAMPKRPTREQARLPGAEVEAVWSSAVPVTADQEAVAWLERFALDPAAVARLDLARVLPYGTPVPPWAEHWFWEQRVRGFGPPPAWRLLLPVYDTAGRLASLRARTTRHPLPKGRDGEAPKEMAPRGGGTTGLLLADSWGRRLLAGEPAAVRRVGRCGLLIAEGTKDLLTVATDPVATVVWGVYSDSWTPEHAARVPNGTTVTLATHADKKGEQYAQDIGRTFAGRTVKLLRLCWSR